MATVTKRDKTSLKKSDDTLRENEEKYRVLLDNASDAILIADVKGNLLEINKKAEELLGYARKDLLGQNISQIHPPEEQSRILKTFKTIHKSRSGNIISTAVLRKDGKKIFVDITGSVIEYGKQKVIQGIFRDITERKKMEDDLRKSEQRYRNVLETMREGYFELDLEGNYTFVNEANCRFLGYTREELIGKNFRIHTAKEAAEKTIGPYRELYKTGKPIESLDLESFTKDGRKVIYETSVSLIKDDKGKLVGFRGISRDVTARKQMEEELRKSEEKYRTILESIDDGYYETDLEGNYTFFNDAEAKNLGYSREEMQGMNSRKYQDEETYKRTFKAFTDLYRTGEPIKALGMEAIRKNGTKVFNEISASLIRDKQGKPIGFRGITRNVTERKRAEEALRQSEQKYRSLTESMTDIVWIAGLDLRTTYVTPSIQRVLGFTQEERIKQSLDQQLTPDSLTLVFDVLNRELTLEKKGGADPSRRVNLELEFYHKDSSTRWLYVTISGIRDDEGVLTSIYGVARDVTERKKMERALHESEERYRTILEEIEEGYFELDLAGNATFFNDSICRIFGYPREELQGLNYRQYTDEENSQKCFNIYNGIYKTGNPSTIQEYEIIRKDKTKRYLETAASLRKDFSGKIIGFRGVSRDITERKKIEEELKKSEEKYRTILEKMDEGYFEMDLGGHIKFFNQPLCSLLGYTGEELQGMSYKKYYDKETQQKIFKVYNHTYQTGEPGKLYGYEIIRKDGSRRFLESSVLLKTDSAGNPIGFRGLLHDITEQKLVEDEIKRNRDELIQKNKEIEESRKNVQLTLEKLEVAYEELKTSQAKILQQEKMASIGQLAAGVAHEINNPVAFISSNLGTLDKYLRRLTDFIGAQAQAIKQHKAADAASNLEEKRKELKIDYVVADAQKLLQESLDGTDRVRRIVQSLNRFSRVDDADYLSTDINECIDQSINIVWSELKYKGNLRKDYGKLSPTKCYPQQLSQVFINLLLNAAQAISGKGEIEIKTREKNKEIWISISDTGTGISDDNLGKIFEPFFTTKEVGKGTGLGLSISYEIIQRHKGDISFESKEGKGTTFTVRIPVVS
ncbi:MAG: PAS domain S-box protein [Syntrophaceae bacterium]|nr:PAS domain S-box protein [Syntrophaceae bacterium]